MTMRHSARILVVVALAASAGCSNGSDDATPSDQSGPAATIVTSEPSTEAGPDQDDEQLTLTRTALTLSDTVPPTTTVSVSSDSLTDDRVIRRGAQPEIRQGQIFVVEEATTLDSISFQVVAEDAVDPSELIALDLYVVEDPTSAVPSGFVDLGSGERALVLPLGESLAPGVPTYLTFSFPAVELDRGQHYAALLSLHDGASATMLYMQHADSDAYPDGIAIRFEGSTWKADRIVGDQAFALTLT